MTESKNTKKSNKKVTLAAALAALVVVSLGLVYFTFGAKPVEGTKSITIEVVDDIQKTVSYEVRTDAEYLRQAMEEAQGLTFSGVEGEYGLAIDTVNGVTANFDTDMAYWAFYVNGEYCNYGIDTQPVIDGDAFQIVYTKDEAK